MSEPLEDKPSITEVLELAGGQLLGNGSGWSKAKCFAHEDRTPSGSVNEDLCKFHCFSCGFSGDSIDIIMAWKGLTFREALAYGDTNNLITTSLSGGDDRSSSLARATRRPGARVGGSKAGRRNFRPSWRDF